MRFCRILLLLTAACAVAQPPSFYLPDDVVPKKYTVDLTIDPSQPTFRGIITIEAELKRATSTIWLNGKSLEPTGARLFYGDDGVNRGHAEAIGGEFIRFDLGLLHSQAASASFSISYTGNLDDKGVVGPYRRKVGNDWYVFTTFTPIDARRAFPSFDEPRFKTPWKLTIRTKPSDRAVANAAEWNMDVKDGVRITEFAETKSMPSEVVAFAVGPFDVFEGAPAGHGTPVRVITTKGMGGQAKAAAQATVDVLPRLEAYIGIPYPFGKLDHLALPEGAYGAVENPGLITYRQSALLAPPDADAEKLRAIRRIEAHEMAHQWFGDLVTQATWNDVWLSEGFATWLSAKVMDEEVALDQKRVAMVTARERIMQTDADPKRTRPVRLAMNSRDEMKGVYSRMVYDKGAAILLMLEGWLGEDKVRDGLRSYIKAHAFANATTKDLESALRDAAKIDPSAVMDSFLDRAGVPSIKAECRDGRVNVQRSGAWSIPVCLRGVGIAHTCSVIDDSHREIELKRACPAWMHFNSGATGYYRTEYSPEQLRAIPRDELTAAERLMLENDLKALADRSRRAARGQNQAFGPDRPSVPADIADRVEIKRTEQ